MATRLRLVLLLLLVPVLTEQVASEWRLWRLYSNPQEFARQPIFVDNRLGRFITGWYEEAVQAGIQRGDEVLAVDGEPLLYFNVFHRHLEAHKPGDQLVLRIRRPGGAERDAVILLASHSRSGDLLVTLIMQTFGLLVCLPLAFGVAWLRPLDLRSWVMLWMMVGFVHTFRLFFFYPQNSARFVLELLLTLFWKETWPAAMAMLGILFPDRLRLRSYYKWPIAVLSVLNVLSAGSQYLHKLAGVGGLLPLRYFLPVFDFTERFDFITGISLVGCYFMLLGIHLGTVRGAAERRRVVLLNAGSHVAFLPLFLLIIRARILKVDAFTGIPPLLGLASLLVMLLFPITLAYLVLVHRALDIRVVLRTGLQYALANRAINMLRMLIIISASIYMVRVVQSSARRVEAVTAVALAVLFAVLSNRGANWARNWMDRRFFREAYNAEQVLGELGQQLRRIVDPATLVETVSRRIAESLHVTHVATLLRDGNGFRPAFALGFDAPPEALFAGDAPVAQRLEQSRTPQHVYLDDPQSWVKKELGGHRDYDLLATLQTQLLLPIEGQGELTGFISLGPKRSEEPYSRGDVQLLQSVVTQAGLALDNTRLTAAVAEEAARRERINQEMSIAGHVQERLFPQRRPTIAGLDYAGSCRPAQSVGGDSFDFMELPDGWFGVSIGDVSGKGIPAAILMAVVQTSLRSNAQLALENLADMMQRVNRVVEEASTRKHFATIFFGAYQPETRELRYVNAAHNPPLLVRASGEAEWLKPTGHAVGWSKRAAFEQSAVALQPGDTLFLYTDGITEAMNPVREEFGEERLLEAMRRVHTLHPEAIIPAMLHAVDEFAAGTAQHDDMTMVVVRVRAASDQPM